jgi:hypothetical protein
MAHIQELETTKIYLLNKLDLLHKQLENQNILIDQLRKNHEEELLFCKKEIYLLIEKNLLFRENFENVILQVLDIANKMNKRKILENHQNHIKIIGELVDNINIMTKKINMDFNFKLQNIKKDFDIKMIYLENKNMELQKENSVLRKDVEILKQQTKKERINELIEQQMSSYFSNFNTRINSKLDYFNDKINRRFSKMKNEFSSSKQIPPFKLQNSKKNKKSKGNHSYRNINVPPFDEQVSSIKKSNKQEGKSINFLKQLFSKERINKKNTYEPNFLNDRSLPVNALWNNKKTRHSNRAKKNNTILELDIRKYQSSQPDNLIEDFRNYPVPTKKPFSRTERKHFTKKSQNLIQDNFMSKFNKITNNKANKKSHVKKNSLHLKGFYIADPKKVKQRKMRIVEKDLSHFITQHKNDF